MKHGRSFFAIPGSQRSRFHMADIRECSCYDLQQSWNVSQHVRAVHLWTAALRTGAAPTWRPAAIPGCPAAALSRPPPYKDGHRNPSSDR
jgi:hypothetical protein